MLVREDIIGKLKILSQIIKVKKKKSIKSNLIPHVDKLALLGYNEYL